MGEHIIADAADVEPGERLIVDVEGLTIGVFNVDGEFYAYENRCLHQYGPVCEGNLSGTWEWDGEFDEESLETTVEWAREGEILNCPWHGWEYDLTSGDCLSDPDAQLRSFPVIVRDGNVVLSI